MTQRSEPDQPVSEFLACARRVLGTYDAGTPWAESLRRVIERVEAASVDGESSD